MGNSRRGPIPSELSWLLEELDNHARRLDTLEAPSGENLANTVEKLQDVVTNLQTYLDNYIAVSLPSLVAAQVAAQLAAAFAGSVSIGGNLTVAGQVRMPNIPATTFVAEPRAVVWVDTSNGRLGRT